MLTYFECIYNGIQGFRSGSVVKHSTANAGDIGSIPSSGRSPGERSGKPLQFFCLGDPIYRGAGWVTVHRVRKSQA